MCRQSPSRGEQTADALLANLGGCDNESIDSDDNDAARHRAQQSGTPHVSHAALAKTVGGMAAMRAPQITAS
jgi:hypothetical protein